MEYRELKYRFERLPDSMDIDELDEFIEFEQFKTDGSVSVMLMSAMIGVLSLAVMVVGTDSEALRVLVTLSYIGASFLGPWYWFAVRLPSRDRAEAAESMLARKRRMRRTNSKHARQQPRPRERRS